MAGTIPLSLTQQLDEFGDPLAGGKLYLIQAGTVSTPQNAYQDSALTIPWPNPIILDGSGRLPQFFLADGSIKIRLTKESGTEVLVADGILVVGASSGGGGGSPVDATTVLATGDVKARYGTGVLSGFVRLNGRTIGSATSGSTERANADGQALFEYLWGADTNLSVSTGRGLTANADWVANKALTLPDMRGRLLGALDDMGTTAAGRITAATITSPTTLGATGGTETKTLITANLPAYTPAGTNAASAVTSAATWLKFVGSGGASLITAGGNANAETFGANTVTATAQTFTGTAQGGTSTPVSSMPPIMFVTYYIKL